MNTAVAASQIIAMVLFAVLFVVLAYAAVTVSFSIIVPAMVPLVFFCFCAGQLYERCSG